MITMRVMTIFIVTKETVVWRINKFSVKKQEILSIGACRSAAYKSFLAGKTVDSA